MEEAELLYHLAREAAGGCIVEVGSYRGRSTVALALGAADGARAPVYAIEPHETFVGALGGEFGPRDRAAFFRTMLRTGCYRNVRLVNLTSEVVASGWHLPIALLWIDGDHTYEGVRRDFDSWSPHLTADATIAFDDTDHEDLGPHRVLSELLDSGQVEPRAAVGKVVAVRRAASYPAAP